ncbi:nitrile hydratase accessory protein [Roseovarius sp. EL26]|uniref:nitrile hydratase accessory protein n=1 Tax=Roseovarius sp. EL26 TaxID=2126672 RepID=UPI0013C46E8A|nr:nitrile hydratase accessory protein [Roseovarius sp. EL26]
MFNPERPLAPPEKAFDEPWQAQALALADTLVQAGHFTPTQWAAALGAALTTFERDGAPDTAQTYYNAVITALEQLTEAHTDISETERRQRRADWEAAYRRTPHGQPVTL